MEYFFWSIAFCNLMFVFETYLEWRHGRKFTEKEIPKEIQGLVDRETFDKSRSYGRDKCLFSLFRSVFSQTETMMVLMFGGLPYIWNLAGYLLDDYEVKGEIGQSVLFMFLFQVYETALSLPWSVYYTFVVEEKHGFNKQDGWFFFKDTVKSFILSTVVTSVVVSCVVYLVHWGGPYFYIYVWLFVLAFAIFAMTIYPDYIAPLFDTFEPLQDGELKEKIEKLAASIDFPLSKLLVVKASQRSSHSNAYFYGFFKNKRIVLFDTLFEKKDDSPQEPCTDEEVVAILSHELGHWKLNHVLKNFLVSQANLLFIFFAFGQLFNTTALYEQFGFHDEKPVMIGLLIIFQFIFAPYNTLVGFLLTVLSRRFEFQADEFAAFTLGYGAHLENALVKIQKGNLGNMNPDKWYSLYHYSHPPLVERLSAIREHVKAKKD
eukprot:Nk52_evm33s158 gene=Nk52_evmTU33s158